MTGTAKTEEEEFRNIYNMFVIQIPTNKEVIRDDEPDLVYSTKSGKYKALKIIIGEGKGRNWWCVMFPPLCFVDDQNGVIDEKTDKKLKEILTAQEYDLIMAKNKTELDNLNFKFKIVEIFQNKFNITELFQNIF